MHCRDCEHFLNSSDANKPRTGLDGYGYCQAAPSLLARSLFFHEQKTCWLQPPAFKERKQ